jgi:hypothetical protein
MSFIGNSTCKHNAHNPHLRCALNPSGPCARCPDYAKANLRDWLNPRLWGLEPRNTAIVKDNTLRLLVGAFVGIQFGVLLAGFVVIPTMNQVIIKTHPCWPQLGVSQYCRK